MIIKTNYLSFNIVPFHTEQDRRHETTANQKSVKIGGYQIDYL